MCYINYKSIEYFACNNMILQILGKLAFQKCIAYKLLEVVSVLKMYHKNLS